MKTDWITICKKTVASMNGHPDDEESVSEALVGVAEGLRDFDGRGSQIRFAVQRARWAVLLHWRKNFARKEVANLYSDEVASRDPSPESLVFAKEICDRAGDWSKGTRKRVIEHCIIEGKTARSLADEIGISTQAIIFHKHGGIEELRGRFASSMGG